MFKPPPSADVSDALSGSDFLTALCLISSDMLQSGPDFQTPLILDDSFNWSFLGGEQFADQFHDGSVAKSGPFSMNFNKMAQGELLDYRSANTSQNCNGFYYGPQYQPHVGYPLTSNAPDADYQLVAGHEYAPRRAFQPEGPFIDPRARMAAMIHTYPSSEAPSITTQPDQRKRKASSHSDYDAAPPNKKAAVSSAQVQVQDPNGDYYDFSNHTSPYSTLVPTPTGSTGFAPAQMSTSSPRPSGHHYSTSTASQVSLAAPSPATPAWSPSFTTVKSEQSPRPPMTPVPRPASAASPLKSSMPKLVRTSTIQTSPTGMPSAMQPQSFNPYAAHPLKADLKLLGDLNGMINDWSSDEADARRRLVEFKRSQSGNTINAEFAPVTPQERAPNSITISCILWKEKKEYYVTSVDTIYLLEALVGVRFTVEEKNRIRRNLEGFRPMTVSKAKLDSEDFFKTIMGFPHPKPRNIEKDVKVFPWKILSLALGKIIGKYSASYSSTASSLLTPAPSAYASHEGSVEYYYPQSPQLGHVAVNGAPYPINTNISYHHGQMAGRMSAPVATAPMQNMHVPVSMGQEFDITQPYGYNAMPGMPQGSMNMTSHDMSAPIGPGWDFPNFIHENPAPASAPPMAYPRGGIDSADFVTPVHYRIN